MDILITDSSLRDYLDTAATPEKIAECLSLCGPSIEKITKVGKETVYHIEVTTNRVDTASAYGIAREAAAILPQFGIKANLVDNLVTVKKSSGKVGISIKPDKKLCERFVAVKLTNIDIKDSPAFIKERLTAIGQRPINNAIDITNYVMNMVGIPLHAFDYDLLGKEINVREAKKGEKFTTLDDNNHTAYGGEIVFDNGIEITDLPGIMGTKNTAINKNTKNILLVSEHMDPLKIRRASLMHETRTVAAIINEKDPDPNAIDMAINFAVLLFEKHANAKVDSQLFDWYPNPRTSFLFKTTKQRIDSLLGIVISKNEIMTILKNLGFYVKWESENLSLMPPTHRIKDIEGSADIVEEIARIYGYFNLPSNLPQGELPTENRDPKFAFENKIKTLLTGWGGVEVYTSSLVSKEFVSEDSLKLKNPLGTEGEYMRTSLTPSLVEAAKNNKQEKESFHLFEMANTYIPNQTGTSKKKYLPVEEMYLAGVFANTDFRHAKGTIEALFEVLGIGDEVFLERKDDFWTYVYSAKYLMEKYVPYKKFIDIPKFPAQIEDITVEMGVNSKTSDILKTIKQTDKRIVKVELVDIYENKYTFRIYYQAKDKTLTDNEVAEIRLQIEKRLKSL